MSYYNNFTINRCNLCYKIRYNINDFFCHKCGGGFLNFGKYKNKSFRHVKHTDPDYCDWISSLIYKKSINCEEFSKFVKN